MLRGQTFKASDPQS